MRANAKNWGARASEHSFKFSEQLKILIDHSSPHYKTGLLDFLNKKLLVLQKCKPLIASQPSHLLWIPVEKD